MTDVAPATRGPSPTMVWHIDGRGAGTPAVDADTVYFLTRDHFVLAADEDTGRVRWRAPLGMDATETAGSRVGAVGDVVVAGGHNLTGLDAQSGARRWTFEPEADYGFGFYLGDARDEVVYAGSASGVLVALHAARGAPLWTTRLGGTETTVYAPSVDAEAIAAAFTDFGPGGARGLVYLDRVSGRERWRRSLPGVTRGARPPAVAGGPRLTPSSVIVSGHDGSVHALRRDDGSVLWSRSGVLDDPALTVDFRPVAVAGQTAVAGSLSGEVEAFDATTGRTRWRVQPFKTSVAFALSASATTVFVPYASGGVVALRATDGHERWRVDPVQFVGSRWSPGARDDDVYLATSESGFFKLRGHGRMGG